MRQPNRERSGLTLVELIVVVAIIVVIMALIFPVILRTMQTLEEAKVIHEIKRFDQACEQFKSTFGRFPPGRILLCEDMRGYRHAINDGLCQNRYMIDPKHREALSYLASQSMEYIQSIFPGIDLNAGHDWNGDGVIDDRQYFLNGSETLVFFLGGMRYGKGAEDVTGTNRSGGMGFNTDKTQPTKKTSSTRLGPFFEFDPSRLMYPVERGIQVVKPVASPASSPIPGHDWTIGVSTGLIQYPGETRIGFFARYSDIWGSPYLYLRARQGITNNYAYHYSPWCYNQGFSTALSHNYHMWFSDVTWIKRHPQPEDPPTTSIPGSLGPRINPDDGTICSGWIEFDPYIESYEGGQVKYYLPQRFQIVSAGRDKQYGSGGFLHPTPSMAETSIFKNYRYFVEENIPRLDEYQANYDNITNITFARVVPRP